MLNALLLCKNSVIKISCLKCCFYEFMMFFNMKIEWVLCELKQLKEKNELIYDELLVNYLRLPNDLVIQLIKGIMKLTII